METPKEPSRWITVLDAASRCPVSEKTVRTRAQSGALASITMAGDHGRPIVHVDRADCATLWPECNFDGLATWEAATNHQGKAIPRAQRTTPATPALEETAAGGVRRGVDDAGGVDLARALAERDSQRERAERAENQVAGQQSRHAAELVGLAKGLSTEFRAELRVSNGEAFARALSTFKESQVGPAELEALAVSTAHQDRDRAEVGASRTRWGAGLFCGVAAALVVVSGTWTSEARAATSSTESQLHQARKSALASTQTIGRMDDERRELEEKHADQVNNLSAAIELAAQDRDELERDLAQARGREAVVRLFAWLRGLR